ncbi:MAG: hypothetical protein RL398_1183, partial [Planctomycetota bacterium]
DQVAAMVQEAVHAAVEQSGLLPPAEVERLVEQSRREFRAILKEREAQALRAQEVEESLERSEAELAVAKRHNAELDAALGEVRSQVEALQAELAAAQAAVAEAANAQAASAADAPVEPAPAATGPSADLLMAMMQEMANMKASLLQQQQQPQAPAAPQGAGADLSAAIDKLAGSLNDRLEKFGKKLGISAAVENGAPQDFTGLFRDLDQKVESNIDNIQVKQTSGGGIAANLAKLKKLKNGG